MTRQTRNQPRVTAANAPLPDPDRTSLSQAAQRKPCAQPKAAEVIVMNAKWAVCRDLDQHLSLQRPGLP